jgi:osmotically-inducible protein OsmY
MVSEYDDRQLEQAIINCCLQHRLVDAGNLEVLVSGGVVQINGEVGSYQQKKAINRLVAASPGVRRVANRLRVVPAAPVGDSALAKRVEQAIRAEAALGGGAISVSARGGQVELKGTVDTATARLDAEYAAWHVPGVREVTNKVHVGTGRIVEERDLSRRLEDALHWCLEVEPWRISIEVDKGVAYLSGRVPSREYAREAEDLVRWHPEISNVVNRLTVEERASARAEGLTA